MHHMTKFTNSLRYASLIALKLSIRYHLNYTSNRIIFNTILWDVLGIIDQYNKTQPRSPLTTDSKAFSLALDNFASNFMSRVKQIKDIVQSEIHKLHHNVSVGTNKRDIGKFDKNYH